MRMAKGFEKRETHDGYVFSFCCDLCGHSVMSPALSEDSPRKAWETVRHHFNMCHECGRWICDTHYNEEKMTCIECVPKKIYCTACGSELFIGELYCKNCGNKI
ncbi:MAG: hypothetical protein Q4C12_01120 [Clostridia bacterium]|nr:hypothetical protein [Clostridia bacterium]